MSIDANLLLDQSDVLFFLKSRAAVFGIKKGRVKVGNPLYKNRKDNIDVDNCF